MSDDTKVLTKARDLISSPERWTQGASARSANGCPVRVSCPDAVSWCALGAIEKAAGNRNEWLDEMAKLRAVVGSSIIRFNDFHTHAEVLAAFDKAIEKNKPNPRDE